MKNTLINNMVITILIYLFLIAINYLCGFEITIFVAISAFGSDYLFNK